MLVNHANSRALYRARAKQAEGDLRRSKEAERQLTDQKKDLQRRLDAAQRKADKAVEHEAALREAEEALDSLRAQVTELKEYRASTQDYVNLTYGP